jgi:hypothetical protein
VFDSPPGHQINFRKMITKDLSELKYQKSKILTSDQQLKDTLEYKKLENLISGMIRSGIVSLGTGYCIGMSDILYASLKQHDIPAELIECHAVICYYKESPEKNIFIGHDGTSDHGTVDTHVVIITKTEIPMIIDLSISDKLPFGWTVIVDIISNKEKKDLILADLHYPEHGLKITYTEKRSGKVPLVYQSSIIDRISTDQKIFRNLKLLKILINIA